jgi:hypothetical protein
VRAIDRATGQPAWSAEVPLPAPILYLLLLDSDRAGRVYVGAETGAESAAPPYLPAAPAIWVQRIEGGALRGMLELPAPSIPDETFRPLTVDDDGTIYQMLPSDTGLEVLRWSF